MGPNQQLEFKNEAALDAFARELGSQLRGGEIIELVGDVGAGKTTFTRGLVKGAGSNDRVTSPTFTVSNVYSAPELQIRHYDFYRLNDLTIIRNELSEAAQDPQTVSVLEWAQEVQDALPTEPIQLRFEVTGEESRRISIKIPKSSRYVKVRS